MSYVQALLLALETAGCVIGSIGFAFGLLGGDLLPNIKDPGARAATAITFAMLSPILVPVAVAWGIGLAIVWLGRGYRQLWRHFFPARIKMPKARVVHMDRE